MPSLADRRPGETARPYKAALFLQLLSDRRLSGPTPAETDPMSQMATIGHRRQMDDLSREKQLQRLEDAETAVRRALQTIEREVHLAKSGSEDADLNESLGTVERELELALAELRGSRSEA